MDVEAVKSVHVWLCVGAGSCAASFITASMPYLQFIAVVFSIAVAVKALFGHELKSILKWKRFRWKRFK